MSSTTPAAPVSKTAFWIGHVLSTLPMLMFIFSGVMKLLRPPGLAEGFAHLGVPLSHAIGLGILELAVAVIYLVPRTAVLGAILVTGYLGGAMQTHLRIGEPVYAHIAFGVAVWGGIFLRDPRLRALIPLRK